MTRYWCRLLLWLMPLLLIVLAGTLLLGQQIPTQEIAFISRSPVTNTRQVRLLDVFTRVSRPLGVQGLAVQWQSADTLFVRGVTDVFGGADSLLWQGDDEPARWPHEPTPDSRLYPSPTAERTLYLTQQMLWHFSVSDPQPQPVPVFQEPIQDVAWSADGNWLAFSSANPPYRLSIVEAACLPECLSTSAIRMIETDTQILNLYWRTPHEITFTTLQANGECNLDGIDIRSRIRSRLMPYNLVQCRALWTSDGSAVYFVNEMPMPGLSIYRWAVGSSQPIQLYQDANTYYLDLMGLSGDETQIFVGAGVPSDIYALNVVSSSLTPLVILPTDDYGASERP